MSNVTRREFFRLAPVVGGAIVFDIEIKQPFAKLLAEKIMQHPAARQVDVAYHTYFCYDDVVIRARYWNEKHQRKFYQYARLDRELYDMPGGNGAEAAAETCAKKLFTEPADYELKHGPHGRVT